MAEAYYHGLLRKHLILFGALFNEIYIDRVDAAGDVQKTIKIPLSYGPKEWYLSRANDNPNLTKPVKQVLPRIAYELKSLRYANERKLNTTNSASKTNLLNSTKTRIMSPVPYDLHIRMTILTRNADDATRIIEQIVPRFTPELTLTLKSIPEVEIIHDVPIVLGNVEIDDQYEGDMAEDDRVVIWNLDFSMKANFYGPIGRSKVIKEIELHYFTGINDDIADVEGIYIQPGLTVDNEPTKNITLSIPTDQINKDDPWGVITTFMGTASYAYMEEDGKKLPAPALTFGSKPNQLTTLTFIIDGGGIPPDPGVKGDLIIPFPCTILAATLIADAVGSCEIDIWKTPFANVDTSHPGLSDSIVGPYPPKIVNGVKYQDLSLIGWNTAINAEDVLRFDLKTISNLNRISISLRVLKAS